MPVQATVILDSGCFLPGSDKSLSTDIGYFQSNKTAWDIRVIADGKEMMFDELKSLGKNGMIEIRHVKADGTIYDMGAKASATFHNELLHLKDLYGEDMSVDPRKFDCILRFDSGLFLGALVKPRYFKLFRQQVGGKFAPSPEDKPKLVSRPIAHNVHIHFKLKDGESIQLARDGEVFWSSDQSGARDRLDIEIIADNTTAEKFYRLALKGKRDSYWLPNQGDPPPMCPQPPCRPLAENGGGGGWISEPFDKQKPAKTVSPQKNYIVSVFYGTTRQRTGSEAVNEYYGYERGDFEYGVCEVSIPKSHKMGRVERPAIWRLEFSEKRDKHIVLLGIKQMPDSDFYSALRLTINNSGEKSAFVFVHGFGVTFAEAARRTAQIAHDLQFDGAPIFYSWPSKGERSPKAYRHDANNIKLSTDDLEKFLMDIVSKTKAKTLHLIAHSMGNQPLTEALYRLASRMTTRSRAIFNEVVLTAPDIDAEVFKRIAQNIQKPARRITLYASSNDKALILSKKYQGNYPRAGDSRDKIVIVPEMDSIDASEVDTSFAGHSYYAESVSVLSDLNYLLKESKPPEKRFGLMPRTCSDGKYWYFRPRKK